MDLDLQVVWGKPARPEWGQTLEITPHSVHALSVQVIKLAAVLLVSCTFVL